MDKPDKASLELEQDTKMFVDQVIQSLPATEQRIQEIRSHQEEDRECQQVIQFCNEGWPSNSAIKGPVKLFVPFESELTVQNGLLMKGTQIVIPMSMRMDMLEKLHTGHQGIVKCRERARDSVWWPGIGRQLQVEEPPVPTSRRLLFAIH